MTLVIIIIIITVVFNASARYLLDDLERRITENTGEARDQLPGFRFWYSASMLSFCITVCRLQTAQTDDRTQILYLLFNFLLPSALYVRGSKNSNNNT